MYAHIFFLIQLKFVSLEQFDQINLNFAFPNKWKTFPTVIFIYIFFILEHFIATKTKALKFL